MEMKSNGLFSIGTFICMGKQNVVDFLITKDAGRTAQEIANF
jgi:hypothetical protein